MRQLYLFTLFLILGLAFQATSAQAIQNQYVELKISSGFNEDVIAEATTAASHTTSSVDQSGGSLGYAFMSIDYTGATVGLPTSRELVSSSTTGLSFKLGNYASDNVLKLESSNDSGTLTLQVPSGVEKLYVLGTSGSGDSDFKGTIHFLDGTTQNFSNLTFPDWYQTSSSVEEVITGIGRINLSNGNVDNNTSDPKIFSIEVSIDNANLGKQITKVDFTKTSSSGYLNIFGLSGQSSPSCTTPDNLVLDSLSVSDKKAYFSWDADTLAVGGYTGLVMKGGDIPIVDTYIDSVHVAAGTNSVMVDGLSKNTYYVFYLRSECGNGDVSYWVPRGFIIADEGVSCENPIEITSIPYQMSDATGNYMNLYSGLPGANCGSTNQYLEGNDVIYHYQATQNYLVEVSVDSLSAPYVGVFVYEACDSIGVSCATSGIAAGNSTTAQNFEFAAEQGNDYYIVVSSAAPTDSLAYHLSITGYDCSSIPKPTGYANPYFIQGDSLVMLEVQGSKFNEGFKWYRDSLLTTQITDPGSEILQDSTAYYVTQTIIGCESKAFKMTPQLFDCSALNPVINKDTVQLCIPGGVVVLNAELSPAGSELRWYTSKNGGDAIGDETSYDAGYVSQTTSFWVSEARVVSDSVAGQAKLTHTGTANTSLSDYGLAFEADESFTIIDVEVYSAGSGGDITIQLQDSDHNKIEEKTFTIPAGSSSSPVAATLTLDFEVPEAGEYYLVKTSSGVDMVRDYSSGNNFPYAIGSVGKVTSGTYGSGTSTSYYWFYNWTIETGTVLCESPREEIVVDVSSDIPDAPKVESPYVFCGSQQDYTIADIQASGVDLHWYDQYGNELTAGTKLIDGESYFVLDKGNGACVSDIAEVEVVIRDISTLPQADTSQVFTAGQMLVHLDVKGDNLQWYADAQKQQPLPLSTPLVDSTTYYVTQQIANRCESDVLGIKVTEELGVADVSASTLQLYPNPVENVLHISYGEKVIKVKLYDLLGRQLTVKILSRSNAGRDLQLDFSGYEPATYFLQIITDRGVKTVQVIKK